ncbi:sugar ABC transporter ATP-binding protein [Edaphobacter albus]|uniref:sugar ABC transporter ATP-binding protein n=1 Tax=Edaphobacter sp. 4G125 TaxID=2763071 RepID=UPI0016446565|nr:sugar ABC transporter ATP-binding protein [Edaphobacter sp. 4G125]QNI36646.1 sugar ABC transporter ATP-binding protein [Edaphobacter sp. 4G125]
MTRTILLRAVALAKSFAGIHALRQISFDLLQGEVHALIGENGAGKSTFTKIATGALAPDAGELWIEDQQVHTYSPAQARAMGIAAIYQQPLLFPHLTVAENIAFAFEAESEWKVNWKQRYSQARELLLRLGSDLDPKRLASTLSMAEQQIVEIAKALGSSAKILFMDEPTALLTDHEVTNLFRLVRQLREEGVGIVYISHRLEEIQTIADRITVLRDGCTIDCRQAAGVERKELIELMVGRSLASIFPKRDVPARETALSVSRLHNEALGLRDITFEVKQGEILGFSGLVGSGRTELARTLFGLSPTSSQVQIEGKSVHITSAAEAIRFGIGYLPEDRRQQGLILDMGITENVSMASLHRVSRWGLIQKEQETAQAERYIHELRIKARSPETITKTLSGGNQQKVALARWLTIHPRIMILDEPTQGVDVGSKSEIHELIMQMAERGVAIILISSELPEILGMCDRIAVFRNRSIVGILSREDATQSKIMALAFGHAENVSA